MTLLWAAALAACLVRPVLAHDMTKMKPGEVMAAAPDRVPPAEVAKELAAARARYGSLTGLQPLLAAVTERTPMTRRGFELFFKDFLPLRAEAESIAQDYLSRHPGPSPAPNYNDLPDADLKQRLESFRLELAKENPAAARRLGKILPQLQAAHAAVMRQGEALDTIVMDEDKGARFLMLDRKKHDDDWAANAKDDPAPWQYAAREKLINGDKEGGLEAARRAVELAPGDAKSLALLASAYFDSKKYAQAVDAARAALAIDPDNATAGAVVKLARDPAEASVATPASSPSDGALGGLPLAPLSEALTTALSPAQQESLRLASQAQKALGLGDSAAAEQAARRAVELTPRYAHGYGLLSFSLAREGQLEEALQASARGLKLNAADRMSHNGRLLALNKGGRYQDALAAASGALEADGSSAYARYMSAVARNGLGDRTGALEELRQAGAIDARYNELYNAALQLSQDGDMSLLFADVGPRVAAASDHRRLGRTYVILGAAAAGGLLAGFGLLGLTRRRKRTTRLSELAPIPAERLLGGQFQVVRRVGQGGMGTVFEGTDVKLHRRVAIKRIRDELRFDAGLRGRFVTEAKLVAALSHPNIVALYSIVDEGEELSLIFEYVQGKTLHDLIAGKGRLSWAQALSVLRGVCDALSAAHARGIIHRDLKPSNIMITAEGAPKVMDFGVARAAKDAVSRVSLSGTVVGTPPYMAPEQEQGAVRVESDVFALAVCLYEALSGALPFGGTSSAMLMNKINKAYTPISRLVSGLPPGLDDVFERAFEPDADLRYRSVAQLRAALEALTVPA